MKRYGPDSLNSWLIACACCFINTMMYGMARLSGVLFVASISRFNVSRDRASLPYAFATFVRNTSGPLVGFLGYRFGVRPIATFGCILGSIGAGACYFAESIDLVTFLWGVVFGLGFGLGNILLPVAINQHFDKHRASASGLSFSGGCLGSFILPPVVDVLLTTYGLSGTFLFLSGFILNCVPAALLLKKPDFDLQTKGSDSEKGETQSIVSGIKVKLYTVENNCEKPIINRRDNKDEYQPKAEDKKEDVNLGQSYDEKIKRLSTQTLLSEYSIHMSVSEPLDAQQIMENSKGRRMVDPKVHETESFSLSSHDTDQEDNSEKDDVFIKDYRSASFQYEKPLFPVNKNRAMSSEQVLPFKGGASDFADQSGYYNYGHTMDGDELNSKSRSDKCVSVMIKTDSCTEVKKCLPESPERSSSYSNQTNSDSCEFLTREVKIPSKNIVKSIDWSDTGNFKAQQETLSSSSGNENYIKKNQSSLGAFSVILDPMFILIAITNAIYNFIFISIITIIVDYARDLEIGTSNEKYILMAFSVGDFIGHLGLGWITDRGYMTTTTFACLCFACQGLAVVALVWADGFLLLALLVSLYGLSEAGLILIYPIIIAQFIDHDKQTVAIPSSNVLSGPLCLAVSPMIGYFRDQIGSYDYVFTGLAVLSGACGITMLLSPYVAKCQPRSRCQTT